MRELAYVQTIKSLSPIEGADKIEKAEILGWELVVKKNDFKVGDLCVYAEIDSIFPDLPCFEFLRPRKFRIKTIKLKGQISQGIAFPLSIINDVDPSFNISTVKVGQDLTEVLKLTKHDPEAELEKVEPVKLTWWEKKVRYYKWKLFGIKPIKSGDFPSDVPKTDEVRVQKMNLTDRLGQEMYITEKVEGTSSTFVYRKGGNWLSKLFGQGHTFLACSRNRIILNSQKSGDSTHHIAQVAKKYKLEEKLKKLDRNLAIQAETIGTKIQGDIYKLRELDFRVFLMYDLDKQEYLPFQEMIQLAKELELPTVPVLEESHALIPITKYYVELSKGKSKINPDVLREGIVIRSVNGDRYSFKSINPEYLLKNQL